MICDRNQERFLRQIYRTLYSTMKLLSGSASRIQFYAALPHRAEPLDFQLANVKTNEINRGVRARAFSRPSLERTSEM